MALKDKLIGLLKQTINDLEAGNSELSESEAMDLMRIFCRQGMSKAMACKYLNMDRNKFDRYIRENKLPKGKKILGYNELRWYRDELDEYAKNIK